MATPNAIAVALFNAAAGGYTAQIAADPKSIANAVGLILEKDISNDALFVEHLLTNFGVTTSMSVYVEARSALFNLVAAQGRGNAVITAIDYLKTQEGAWNDYALVALNFSVKVSEATMYSVNHPTERDITKLVSAVTGVDTDQLAITQALSANSPAFAASLQAALASASAAAQAEKNNAVAAQKALDDALAKAAADKAAADLRAFKEKAEADALAAKTAYDKLVADTAATLKTSDNLAVEAAIKAAIDKAAAAAAVDKTADNAAAITAYLKATAATLSLTGYESMTDTQLVNLIKYSDNQSTAASVDKTTDNPAAITAYLKLTAAGLNVIGYSSMTDAQLISAIRTSNDATVVSTVDKTTDNAAAITTYLRNTASSLNIADYQSMSDAQLINAIKTTNDTEVTLSLTEELAVANNRISELTNLSGRTFELSLENDSILAISGGDDTITATNLTYATDDMVVDTSLVDNDVFTLSTSGDITAVPVVVGMENFNVNVTSVYAGDSGPTVLAFNADNVRNSTLNFDVTNSSSVVTGLTLTYLPTAVPVTTSNEFKTVSISADDNAVVRYTGYATSLTLESPDTLTDVFATVNATTAGTITTDSDAVVTVSTAYDTTVTAAAASSVDITSAGQATVVANAADSVKVTATEEALITANSAENVTIIAGDGIDTISASVVDSTLTSSNPNTMTVNIAGRYASTVVDIIAAPNVDHVNITGSQNVTLKVSLVGIDGLGTATTGTTADDNLLYVSKANSGTATIWIKTTGGDADFSQAIVTSIVVAAALTSSDDLTVANGALVVVAADQSSDLSLIAKNSLTASTNSVQIAVQDNAISNVDGDLTGGLTLAYFGSATLTNNDANSQAVLGPVAASGTALTIAAGTQGFSETSTISLGSANLSVTGSGAVNLGEEVSAGAVLGANANGAITIGLKGLDGVANVTTGLGNDVLSIFSAVLNTSRSYTLATGTGTDTLTLSIAQGFSWSAGADYDTLKIVGDLDLSESTISLNSVDEIQLDSALSGGAKTVTINPSTFSLNNVFNLRGNSAGVDVLVVQGTSTAETINANLVAVDPNYAALMLNGAAGNDTITGSAWSDTINGGSGNDLLSGGYYGDTYIYNAGDVDAGDTIIEPASTGETDLISVVTTTEFTNMTASSFDEIESITLASGQTATFTGLQLTGEVIAFSGSTGSETLIVNVGEGQQFTSLLTNAAANIESVQYIGTSGAESIAGGAMTETITGGTGNDLLSGGAGNDTFIFSSYSTNGLDRITLGVLDGTAVDDKLNLAVNVFINDGTPQIGLITETSVTSALTTNLVNDNVLILKNVYFADAAALVAATTLFAASGSDGNVLIIYASSATTDARIAFATLTDAGDVTIATDIAVLVGLTVENAFTGLSASNFIL